MGFFDAVKKAFDSGGIKVNVLTQESFSWSDESIPLTVVLTGHKSEPRTVTELRFSIREDATDDDSSSSGGPTLNFTHSEVIEVPPLQQVTVEVAFPLDAPTVDTADAGWAGKLMKAIGSISLKAPWYIVMVSTTVEGAGAAKSASYRIRRAD